MEQLPDISKQISDVMNHYVQSIKLICPQFGDLEAEKKAQLFVDAWLNLQREKGLWLYWGFLNKAKNSVRSDSAQHSAGFE